MELQISFGKQDQETIGKTKINLFLYRNSIKFSARVKIIQMVLVKEQGRE